MKNTEEFKDKNIKLISMHDEMSSSYLSYAMSVIVSRALPDVRDGLKPVHRRILYAMYKGGYDWSKQFRKSARIVGDVIGKYHPHGDQSVYDALVRMVQDFSMSLPLVDGQGNFGSIDGDPAAAMRYTETRLSKVSQFLIDDIEKKTIDFKSNYDETEKEPTVLPSQYPYLLVNGAGGIAVGMATSIPPHNLGEIINGTLALIDNFWSEADRLQKFKYLDQDGEFCQCTTEKFIRRCKDSKEMRSFLMVGILIDQCIHYQIHDEFKVIFWWEWAHRFLGRIIGLFFLIPLIYFIFRLGFEKTKPYIFLSLIHI
mgnify:CR=1 FL=1